MAKTHIHSNVPHVCLIHSEYTKHHIGAASFAMRGRRSNCLVRFGILCITIFTVVLPVQCTRPVESKSALDQFLKFVECFVPVGGGFVHEGRAMPQAQLQSEKCIKIFERYFREDGEYYTNVRAAIDTVKFFLEEKGNYTRMALFDIDETMLSNLPYYASHRFTFSRKTYDEWSRQGIAPPLLPTLEFYKALRRKGFSVAILTGRREILRNATEANLERAGYGSKCTKNPAPAGEICYYKLILRDHDHRDATMYKAEARGNLTADGFDILIGIGDQWSDLLNNPRPPIVVKMPNPLYYLP